jgi:hypothetical protein
VEGGRAERVARAGEAVYRYEPGSTTSGCAERRQLERELVVVGVAPMPAHPDVAAAHDGVQVAGAHATQ